jgi:hypothetical protein
MLSINANFVGRAHILDIRDQGIIPKYRIDAYVLLQPTKLLDHKNTHAYHKRHHPPPRIHRASAPAREL